MFNNLFVASPASAQRGETRAARPDRVSDVIGMYLPAPVLRREIGSHPARLHSGGIRNYRMRYHGQAA